MIVELLFYGLEVYRYKKAQSGMPMILKIILALIFLGVLIALVVFWQEKSDGLIDNSPKLFEGLN